MTEAEQRKSRSIARLKQEGIPYILHLPVIEDSTEVKIPSLETIARRAVCTLMTIQHACDLMQNDQIEESRDFLIELLTKWGIKEDLTPKELHIFSGEATEQEIINMAWKYEAYWVLIWALGYIDDLDKPIQICDCERAIRVVDQFDSLEAFIENAKLRPVTEILDQADLIFRYDWACVDARLNNKSVAGGLESGVVYERHCALNWLIGYGDDWDNISADT
ncbi:DUF4272 domain-containing protein [Escherichia whittamii]|uniref:DUF4272 domain-containing protein n=1 Tax=Escherichia whittamii TaxID=2762229 RepID=UPI002DB9EFF0|nr:DUF4272 domain-containing protein [Escherichia whittamii]MEB7938297.1 DUF4272 domain-containing protein [Escherichia whittamii]